jgi:hypothetical protein
LDLDIKTVGIKEMNIQPFIHERRIVWTMTTSGYKYYTMNLRKWLQQVALVPWILCIICCDQDSYTFFRRENIPCIFYKDPAVKNRGQVGMAPFGSNEFKVWNRIKVDLLRWFCTQSLDWSLYLDGDIVVQRDPWPELLRLEGNLFFQCDCGNADNHTDCGNICSGVIATRHVSPRQADLYSFDSALWKESFEQDQPYIAERLKQTQTPFHILSRPLFGNGYWQQKGPWTEHAWVLLHYNYRHGDNKKAALRAAGHWLLIGAS